MMKSNYDLHIGQETWKELEKIHKFGYSYATIFSDFIDACLLSLLSLTENMQHPDVVERVYLNKLTGKYEAQYLELVGRYKENKMKRTGERPIDYIAQAFGLLRKEARETGQDILGEIYMTKISLGEHGQFFTPPQITDMMVKMLYAENNTGRTVSDPCCGSGRFFISMAKRNKALHFYGIDLSQICAKMTALNMWLFDLDADIYHGNSLSMELFHIWKIRTGGFLYESVVEQTKPPLPEPVKIKLQAQAKQQRLFDFDEIK